MSSDQPQPSQPSYLRTELVPAQVPRRFPVGTMLVLVAVFAVLLSALRTAQAYPEVIVLVTAFVLCVGVGQVVLFRGQRPREASALAGGIAWFGLGMAYAVFLKGSGQWGASPSTAVVCAILGAPLCGVPAGYLVGGVLAGVFLIGQRIRTGQWNETRSVEVPVTAELVTPRVEFTLPTLGTERLLLRPFTAADAAEVQRLAGDAEVASMTTLIPHPYPDGLAESWIATHAEKARRREAVTLAIVRRQDRQLLGAISVQLFLDQGKGELGYWIGRPYWNQGYATEAARALLAYVFQRFVLIQVFALHLVRNPASGRVLEKLGMERVGILREHREKDGVREDCVRYEILRYAWLK